MARLKQPCAWSGGFLRTGISNPSSTSATRSASEEKEEQKTPTKIAGYELDSFLFHLLPDRVGLPSHSCHTDAALSVARRCWHGKFVLPNHHHPFPVCPKPSFFGWGRPGKHKVTCSAHWGVWGAHHSSVGCTGGSSPAAAEGWVWHWARGVQKQQHQPFCQSFLPQSPTGQRQCQQISRNAGLEGKSGSLRGTLQTVGICPQRSFPRATGDHSWTPMAAGSKAPSSLHTAKTVRSLPHHLFFSPPSSPK